MSLCLSAGKLKLSTNFFYALFVGCVTARTSKMLTVIRFTYSGVGTGGSGGSMNRGPRAPGAPE